MKMKRSEISRLKKNGKNARMLILELMKNSSIDFTVEHASYKLYKCGFLGFHESQVFKVMESMCRDGLLVFNGFRPVKVNSRLVGYERVYGLIK